jgi:carboxyl-terminal processing protease
MILIIDLKDMNKMIKVLILQSIKNNREKMKFFKTIAAAVAILVSVTSFAQSNDFKLGQNMEIQYSILKELSKSYVDTIDYGKIIPIGIKAMLQSLDPYTTYIPEEEGEDFEMMTTGAYGGIGSLIKKSPDSGVQIVEPYPGSPAVKAGMVPGDVIIAIDGVSVYGETSAQSANKMKGQPGTDVVFTVIRGRTLDTVDITVTRERIQVSDIAYSEIIRDSIGYIALTGFTQNMHLQFKESVLDLKKRGAKRLVIDLRGNVGGIMEEAVSLMSLFVPEGTLVLSSKGREERTNEEYYTTTPPIDTIIPVLVMVDSGSASSSEIVAGVFQDLDRGAIAGRRTFGKGLIQSIKPTLYDGKVKITTGKYYTPSGRCVQAIDYSHRNEDGSVGNVPDSLKREFKTRLGRSVYDGGGITPDLIVPAMTYSRPAYSLVYNDILGDFAIEYFKKNLSIAPASEFRLTDEEYEDFISYAGTREFDIRSSAESALDQLIKAAKQDGLYEVYKSEIDALSARIKVDKETMLRLKKDEIVPLLEEEIVVKYYLRGSEYDVRLRDDQGLYQALDWWK